MKLRLAVIVLTVLALVAVVCCKAQASNTFTIYGLVKVKINNKYVPLNEVANPTYFNLVFKYNNNKTTVTVAISADSRYEVKLPLNKKVYVCLKSSVGEVNAKFEIGGILYDSFTTLPFPGRMEVNITVTKQDLEKILPSAAKRAPKFTITKFEVPSKVIVNETFTVNVTLRNIGNAPGRAIVTLYYDSTLCGNTTTGVVKPGETWSYTFKCKIPKTGTYTLKLLVNGTVASTKSIEVVKPTPKIIVKEFSAPSTVYVNEIFDVTVKLVNEGTATGRVTVEVRYDDKSCGSITATISPGETWTHVFKCRISEPGKYTLKLLLNGTVVNTRSIEVKSRLKPKPKPTPTPKPRKVISPVSIKPPPPVYTLKSAKVSVGEVTYSTAKWFLVVPGITVGTVANIAVKSVDNKLEIIIPSFTVPTVSGRPVVLSKITIRKVSVDELPKTPNVEFVLDYAYVVETSPRNIVFSQPVTIKIKVPEELAKEDVRLAVWDSSAKIWIILPTEIKNGTLIAHSKILGIIAVVREVKPPTTNVGFINVKVPSNIVKAGTPVVLTVQVLSREHTPLPNKLVEVYIDGTYVAYGVTNSSGITTITLVLRDVGVHRVTVTCEGVTRELTITAISVIS